MRWRHHHMITWASLDQALPTGHRVGTDGTNSQSHCSRMAMQIHDYCRMQHGRMGPHWHYAGRRQPIGIAIIHYYKLFITKLNDKCSVPSRYSCTPQATGHGASTVERYLYLYG